MAKNSKQKTEQIRSSKSIEKKIEWTDQDLQTTFSSKDPEIIVDDYPLEDPAVFWINEKSIFCRLNWGLWSLVNLRRPNQFELFSNANRCQLIHPVKNAIAPIYHIHGLPKEIFKNFKKIGYDAPQVRMADYEAGENSDTSESKLSFRDKCIKQIKEITGSWDVTDLSEDNDPKGFSPIFTTTEEVILLFSIVEQFDPGDLDEIAQRLQRWGTVVKDSAPGKPIIFGIVCSNATCCQIESRLKEEQFAFIRVLRCESLKEDLIDVLIETAEKNFENLVEKLKGRYLIIDLTDFSVELRSDVPEGGWTDEYKTSKLVLRYIPSGRFMMGSPEDELGRRSDETLHPVALTEPYYIGAFQLTERQYELITGEKIPREDPNDPNSLPFSISDVNYDVLPMRNLSYDMIRGKNKGSQWPVGKDVDEDSILGILRKKTGLKFDLPTEAQWEKACRAGTETAFNNGTNITNTDHDKNLDPIAHYYKNCDEQDLMLDGEVFIPADDEPHAPEPVGSFLPNAWGLYDMHGNVGEWCLDWYGPLGSAHEYDPEGPESGTSRVIKGGDWVDLAYQCRSASRIGVKPDYDEFREDYRIDPYYFMLIGYTFRLAISFKDLFNK